MIFRIRGLGGKRGLFRVFIIVERVEFREFYVGVCIVGNFLFL